MDLFPSLRERLAFLKHLTPAGVKALADAKLNDLILKELGRSRDRVAALEKRYPSAGPRELCQHLVEAKKNLASMLGGVSGVFGLASIPADFGVMTFLQVILLVDVATVYKVNLKADRARKELVDLLFDANGVGPVQRAGPKVLGTVAGLLLQKGGLKALGRAVPLVAAPVTAYLNNQHIQRTGEEAIRHYDGFAKARQKTKAASS